MIGKKLKVNDYKFTYGQETIYLNMFGAFKSKNGNKYAIYSYEDKKNKLFYGSFFKRNKEAVIMSSKENPKEIVKEFIDMLLKEEKSDKFETISLDEIDSIEIIEEFSADFAVDTNKLYDLTIPKPVVKEEKEEPKKTKKPISLAAIFFGLFIIVVIAFFFVNPEVIIGKDRSYSCTKSYLHSKLPASVTEEIFLTFNGKGNITNIDITTDYIFNNTDYYMEFRDKSYFYQYIEEGDTYKFVDESYTYRLFSKIDLNEDYFLPTEESPLVAHYEEKNYTCKRVEVDE